MSIEQLHYRPCINLPDWKLTLVFLSAYLVESSRSVARRRQRQITPFRITEERPSTECVRKAILILSRQPEIMAQLPHDGSSGFLSTCLQTCPSEEPLATSFHTLSPLAVDLPPPSPVHSPRRSSQLNLAVDEPPPAYRSLSDLEQESQKLYHL